MILVQRTAYVAFSVHDGESSNFMSSNSCSVHVHEITQLYLALQCFCDFVFIGLSFFYFCSFHLYLSDRLGKG